MSTTDTRQKPMAQTPKKAVLAAITVAIASYLQTQETPALATVAATVPATGAGVSLYGAYGRQQMMEMRRLLSLRLGRR